MSSIMDESRFHMMDHMLDLKTPSPYDTRHTPSPIFKTPGKYVSLSQNSPRYKTTPGGNRALTTPKRRLNAASAMYNPFENHTVDFLHLPTFSPNVFSKGTSTPSRSDSTPQKFRWSIDQQALLHPADIDEMPHHQLNLISVDDENTEYMAQQAIDTFFTSNMIAPSPWSETNKTVSRMNEDMKVEASCKDTSGNRSQTNSSTTSNKKDVGCQTTLTIPSDIDVQSILGEFFTYIQEELAASGSDVLSISTLRRKLFFNGGDFKREGSATSGSSLKTMSTDHSPSVSPLRGTTPEKHSPIVTPASTQFSSSPIASIHRSASPAYRRGSFEFTEHLSSPELSPINTPVSKQNRYPLTASAVRRLDVETLFGSAHGSNISPSCGRPSISPDLSPIANDEKQPKSVEKDFASKTRTRIEFGASPKTDVVDSGGDTRNESAAMMDVSGFQDLVTATTKADAPQWPWGLSTIRETSINESELTNAVSKSSTNHDTGYQTGSLQSATDLTNQMGSLPLSSRDCTMADDTELDGSEGIPVESGVPTNRPTVEGGGGVDDFKRTNVFRLFANCGQQTNVQFVQHQNAFQQQQQPFQNKLYPGTTFSGYCHAAAATRAALAVSNPAAACMNTSGGPVIAWNPVGSSTPEKLNQLQSIDVQID
ncbi:uncharacterized protein LOC141912927 [Tubulanus polymorphus]|uniref:uncharacterized protein LOC141912927 n=1 Tax=Tubulanus polymorphus TaxID=672921 RepID=UPI003DA38D01